MHVVTGGAGFIGSNLVRKLLDSGHDDVIVVDDLRNGHKFVNIADLPIADYIDKDDFLQKLESDKAFATGINAVLHQGACSETTEWDGRFMMQNNYAYSQRLLHHCLKQGTPSQWMITADSSANSSSPLSADSRASLSEKSAASPGIPSAPQSCFPILVWRQYSSLLVGNGVSRHISMP
ncbi:MAG: NAD-dependent epimerase/dehydratase family protein, partial [Proteobacteria bacterium]|nr:NAD-dependent epimerase/dehydratase family protein [Pseudomonadota bacterium]